MEAKRCIIGKNVTAGFDEKTCAIEIYSDNGVLSASWVKDLNIPKSRIISIRVAEGTVHLPKNAERCFANLRNLQTLDMTGFNTSDTTNMKQLFHRQGFQW